ncbi:efflux RND transporter periplasmic adaptor subunit [Cytobacillus pseudoceanisediminis]|uniref:efflux RND transporter periplasmic adaptor subunit n=1 Tax=Cytobacillus pseudoceanisediminis TaxID=3051614 RepID=UPI00218B3B7C|nr:efflux RND transporter periplasmic adaptor subunit [Cytobacillus pseudoceanisediminis]UQX53055.1 efflux RND transporter periplasmic adaptor subunit [Cytobacillus pseudoceanisediminis]
MKKKVWIAIGVTAVFLLLAGVSVYRQAFAKGPEVKTSHPVQEEIKEQIMIPGTAKLVNEQKIYASPEKGEIKEFLVEEGDSVKKERCWPNLMTRHWSLNWKKSSFRLNQAI